MRAPTRDVVRWWSEDNDGAVTTTKLKTDQHRMSVDMTHDGGQPAYAICVSIRCVFIASRSDAPRPRV
jgi:hypothetical protein